MSLLEYLRGKCAFLLMNIFLISAIMLYLLVFDIPRLAVAFIAIGWLFAFSVYILLSYWKRRAYFAAIEKLEENVPVYQIAGLLDPPVFPEAKPFYTLLAAVGERAESEIGAYDIQKREYQDYIETWVHEIKNPISGLKLIIEADRVQLGDIADEMMEEIGKIENYVEQTLYVARVENAEKDYLVREFPVMRCVKDVLKKQRQQLERNGVKVQVVNSGITVLSDEKWLGFILSQLLFNAMQYAGKEVKIWTKEETQGVFLYIEDDGMGIAKGDLPRVFEKGFTGETGRRNERSTGLGLYLVKSLCQKLEHGIELESEEGKYTRVMLTFPKSSYISLKERIQNAPK